MVDVAATFSALEDERLGSAVKRSALGVVMCTRYEKVRRPPPNGSPPQTTGPVVVIAWVALVVLLLLGASDGRACVGNGRRETGSGVADATGHATRSFFFLQSVHGTTPDSSFRFLSPASHLPSANPLRTPPTAIAIST